MKFSFACFVCRRRAARILARTAARAGAASIRFTVPARLVTPEKPVKVRRNEVLVEF